MATYKGKIGQISVKSDQEVEWAIENFFSYTAEDEYYYSPSFYLSGSKWYLEIYPNGETAGNSVGWMSLYLHISTSRDGSPPACTCKPVGACCTFNLKKADETVEQIGNKFSWVFEEDGIGYGLHSFLERSELLLRASETAPQGSLTLICTLLTEKFLELFGSQYTLSRCLADLFNSKKSCDATLKVMDEEFSVHKLILSSRSSVFAAMFEVNMKEKRTGVVEIPDCNPVAFRDFLMYLYSGKVENFSSNALEVYKIADKYSVEDLKLYCLVSIVVNLSVENVLDTFLLGSQLDEGALTEKSQTFFNKNFKKVISTTKWDSFLIENVTVANRLLKDMAKD